MKLNFSSFRFKIILTLILVISVCSYMSIYLYSYYLSKRIYKNAESNLMYVMKFLRDEINSFHDGRLIKPLLKNMGHDKVVFHTFLFDSVGRIKFPVDEYRIGNDSLYYTDSIKKSVNLSIFRKVCQA